MFESSPGLAIWTIINFLLLLLILWKFAWGPILAALEQRERTIQDSLNKAQDANAMAEKKAKEFDQLLQASRQESAQVIAEARERGDKLREEILRRAEEEAATIKARAVQEINQDRAQGIKDIRRYVVDLSLTVASKVIQKNLTDEDQRKLAQQTLTAIEEAG